MKRVLSFLFLLLFATAISAQNDSIAYWGFNEMTGNETHERISNAVYTIHSLKGVERVAGVNGNALRTDGYTSWAAGTLPTVLPPGIFSVSAWVALESFPAGTADIWSAIDPVNYSGFRIGITQFGRIEIQVSVDGRPELLTSPNEIALNKWLFITATVDATAGRMQIFVNGMIQSMRNFNPGRIDWSLSTQFIGRSMAEEKFIGLFPINSLNGLIDEVTLWNRELSAAFVKTTYQSTKPANAPDLHTPITRFQDDFNRPRYHAIPQSGWTNEPHGLVYFGGKYHFFNQKNANGPFLRNINWGHQTSDDLVHWSEAGAVLWPQPGYDQLGIWSGHLVLDKGIPTIFYTGVAEGFKQTICMAVSTDSMKTFTKFAGNPIIPNDPSSFLYNEMRDPYVFREKDSWYMICGSGISTKPAKGTVILFRSPDLKTWEYLGPMWMGDPRNDETGIFWEMPVFWKFKDNYVLSVNRVPVPGTPAKTFYWIGKFRNGQFLPAHKLPKSLDLFNWFLVPSVNRDEAGRTIAIGFIADLIPAERQYQQGWTHSFSLPRVWDLRGDSVLTQKPHPNLRKLRGEQVVFNKLSIKEGDSSYLKGTHGYQLEIEARIDGGSAKEFGFILGKSPGNLHQLRISYNYDSSYLTIDRSRMPANMLKMETVSHADYSTPGREMKWNIFIDGSVVEVFLNDESAFVTRMFPGDPLNNFIDLFAHGGSAIASVKVWKLNAVKK